MAEKTALSGPLTGADVGEFVLYVRDIDTMLTFYRDTLGLELERRTGRIAVLRGKSGAEIVLHEGRRDDSSGTPHWLLQFIVDDIETVVHDLRSRGVDVGDIDRRPYGAYARFSDPEGNPLGVEEPGGESN